MTDDIYEKIYRKLHPGSHLYRPFGQPGELSRLWPSEQEKFKKEVDTILKVLNEKTT